MQKWMRNWAIPSTITKNKGTKNSRNGYSSKTMHTSYGDMGINIPRDRNGELQ